MKILFICSDGDIAHMTAKILSRNKYGVSVAAQTSEALDMLASNIYDLVILDCDMRDSDRDCIIQSARTATSSPRLLTISGYREDEVPLLKAGADDWIQKPYQMDVLLARMAALLR